MKRFRKLVALLLAAVMVTGVFPAGATASQVEPMSFTTTHINPLYRDSITEADLPDPVFSSPSQLSGVSGTAGDIDEAAASLRDQMEERMEEAVVSIFLEDVTQEIFEATATEILDEAFAHTGEPTEGDYLQWHYGGCNISGEVDGADGGYILNLIYTVKYHSTAAQEAELDKAVDALLAALDLEDENDYRKVKGVYDYICANITYDYDSSGYLKHTAYAALVNKTAVCQGYASLLYRLLLELGVDTRVIAGTGGGGNHGWNIVELKDLYYNADSTWDAGSSHYNYFLRSMNDFPDHSRWEEYATADFNAEYPMDSKNYTPTTCEANGHAYSQTVTAPTCKEQGYTTYTCTGCGDSYRDDYTETVPHSWDEGIVTTQPTETEAGVKTYTCGTCGDTRTEEIPKLEHTHVYTSVVTEPTCKTQGYTTHTCACGHSYRDTYTETIPHSWDEGVVTTQPTETETGVKTYTCGACGETKTEEIPMLEPAKSSVKRVAGTSRADTALEVADALKEALGVEKFDTIIIANGEDKNFPDALTGSYLATVKEAPILMYRTSGLSENTRAYIRTNLIAGGTVYLLGGELAIPVTVAEELTAAGYTVERLAGGSRFDTNLAILEEAGVGGKEILIARGFEFADSLSASATGLPILMVNEVTGKLTEAQIQFLQKYENNAMTILGGTVAVSEALEATIEEVVGRDVDRVAGGSREATSVEIAKRYFDVPDFAVIAYSRKCPDGLCGGPLAYAMGAPLLLVNAGQERYANAYTAENEITAGYVLGGTLVVTDATARAVFGLAENAVIEMK